MSKIKFKKFLFMILIAAMIMTVTVSCTGKESGTSQVEQPENVTKDNGSSQAEQTGDVLKDNGSSQTEQTEDVVKEDGSSQAEQSGVNEGATSEETSKVRFTFIVVDREGQETSFGIATDKETVGEALLDEKLIEGDEGAYGLYVKKVNGIEAVYENDGTYWSFYINGEYAMTGVDTTKVEEGATYTFKVEGN